MLGDQVKNVREVALGTCKGRGQVVIIVIYVNQEVFEQEVHEKVALLTEIVAWNNWGKITLDLHVKPFISKQKNLQDWVHVFITAMSIFNWYIWIKYTSLQWLIKQ